MMWMGTLMLGLLGLTACVEHRAVADLPADLGDARGSINASPVVALPKHITSAGHLPRRLLVHGYHRGPDGSLTFLDADTSTPLVWWQRFPADLISHCLWPGTLRSESVAEVRVRQPGPTDRDTLTAHATAAGYPPARSPE